MNTTTNVVEGYALNLRVRGFLAEADLLEALVKERDAAQEAANAAAEAMQLGNRDACTAGMSWAGKNIVGDRASVDYVKSAVHFYEQREAYFAAWKEREQAARESARLEGLEEAALAAEKWANDRYGGRSISNITNAIRSLKGGTTP
jgi:hypothetical protein